MIDAKLTTRDGLGIPFQFSDNQQFEKAQKECKYQGVTLKKVDAWKGLVYPYYVPNIMTWVIPSTKLMFMRYYLNFPV